MRRFAVAATLAIAAILAIPASATVGTMCHDPNNPVCDQHSLTADQQAGEFQGLIMVPGEPGVLDAAAHSGTQPGCGDCEWTLLMACLTNSPDHSSDSGPCTGAGESTRCDPGQQLYRLYLTTDAVQNQLVDHICLGPTKHVIAVGDQAATDVRNYLKDVTPPDLVLHVQPPNGVLADLPAYFAVQPPAGLRPQPFGGAQVTETITIRPAHYTWHWGDATADLQTDDPGGPYPDGHVTHTYPTAGHVHGSLQTQWAATYTITVPGAGTFGPYDATGGTITKTQQFHLTVDAAHSHLVSGG